MQALEGEIWVELLDLPAVAHDDDRRAAGGDDPDVHFPQLFAQAADEGVYGAGVAVDEAAADGVGVLVAMALGGCSSRSTPGSLAVRATRASRAT